jgi:S-adenosylmethionine-dependent methyltransferase
MSDSKESFANSLEEYLRDIERPWGKLFYDLSWDQIDEHLEQDTKTTLDVGCGFGLSSVRMSEKGHQVTGLDITPEMLAVAKQKAEEKHQEITFLLGKIEETDQLLAGKQFDWVLCHNVLEYLEQPEHTIQKLSGLLTSNGHVSIIAHNPAAKVFKKAILNQEFKKARESIHQKKEYNPLIRTYLTQYSFDTLAHWLSEAGLEIVGHYGIRCIYDYIVGDQYTKNPEWYQQAFLLEKEVGSLSPYRDIASFTHIIAQKKSV